MNFFTYPPACDGVYLGHSRENGDILAMIVIQRPSYQEDGPPFGLSSWAGRKQSGCCGNPQCVAIESQATDWVYVHAI